MASGVYSFGLLQVLNGTVDTDTTVTKIGLAQSSYAPAKTEAALTTFAASEATCTGYTGGFGGAGRKTASVSLTETSGVKVVNVFTDLTWTALGGATNNTLGYAVWLREVTNDAASIPLAFLNFVSNVTTNGSDILSDFATSAAGGNVSWSV